MNLSDSLITTLPIKALALPIAMLLLCAFGPVRRRLPDWLWVLPVPALLAALFSVDGPRFEWYSAPYRFAIALDQPGAMLLGASSALWIAAGFYAATWFRRSPNRDSFALGWLLTLIGSLGIFLAADLGLFLIFYALVSLPAYVMIIHDGTNSACRAGSIYLAFALLGEGLLLLAFVLLFANAPDGNLRIEDLVRAIPGSAHGDAILGLLVIGFGMKMALVPLHFWMPLTYSAAPIPAAAVLSGAGVKAAVIGLIRFLPLATPMPDWGHALAIVGLAGAFVGVAIGITQENPKAILAYSSVSQMGFLATLLGMGLAGGDLGVANSAAYYGAHHVLVKGGLFLAIGVAGVATRSQISNLVIFPAAVIALGLAGLPLTGGSLAKLAAKDSLGYGIVGTLAAISAAGTTLLMLHFIRQLAAVSPATERPSTSRLAIPWLGVALAAFLLPAIYFPLAGLGTLAEVLAPAALWKTFWPLLLGTALAVLMFRFKPNLPHIPIGDVAAFDGILVRLRRGIGAVAEQADAWLRRWPVAGSLVCALGLLLAALMFWRS